MIQNTNKLDNDVVKTTTMKSGDKPQTGITSCKNVFKKFEVTLSIGIIITFILFYVTTGFF